MYEDNSGTLNLVINVSASQTLRCKISLFELTALKCLRNLKSFVNFNIHVSSLLIPVSSLHFIVKNTSELL